jgi:hypothetical protein
LDQEGHRRRKAWCGVAQTVREASVGCVGGEIIGARDRPRPIIAKRERNHRLCPNLVDYDTICRHFSWESARLMLEGLPGGRGLNIG